MKTLRFEGYSDDTFGEYAVTGEDVDNFASGRPVQCIVDCGEHGRLMVVGQYYRGGCWLVGAGKVDEDDPWPDWKITLKNSEETPYSACLEVELPTDQFSLTWFSDGNKVTG